jgi:ATP-binding cassette subfamily F protein uup
MNILQLEHLSKNYGEKVLFNDISLGVSKGQKVALIARNGTGKTTLMNIIAGTDVADSGQITIRRDTRIAYLRQNPSFDPAKTVLDILFTGDNEFMNAIHDYEEMLEKFRHEHNAANQRGLDHSIARMDALQAWDYETKVREILGRFGINDLSKPAGDHSGGQIKKIALAGALIGNPDLLLLDEPTNHLDFEMIEWLEDYLSRESLTLLLITHDRYFLDNVCDTIVELENDALWQYKGNYSYYLEKKAERQSAEELSFEKSSNLYRTELEWIRRMPKARGTKSKARIETFDDLKEKVSRKSTDKQITFDVSAKPLGGKIIEVNNISKKFGNDIIIDDFSYIFKKGEKIGVVGLNGAGKSTLLNIISGYLRPDKGNIVTGQTVVIGYYTQEGLQPVEDKRVIDIVKDIAEEISMKKGSLSAAQFLYRFNFSYAVQHAYFSALSGGEKRRLYLLLQLMQNPNFLILDEPTNDLDIFTLQVLEDFLTEFPGCLLVVSHDRFLLDKLCDHVFVFEGNGKIKDFYGNYTAYYQHRMRELKKQQQARAQMREPEIRREKEKKTGNKPTYKQKQELEKLELEISLLETEKSKVLTALNSGESGSNNLHELSIRYGELEQLIEEKTLRWMELGEIMEA